MKKGGDSVCLLLQRLPSKAKAAEAATPTVGSVSERKNAPSTSGAKSKPKQQPPSLLAMGGFLKANQKQAKKTSETKRKGRK